MIVDVMKIDLVSVSTDEEPYNEYWRSSEDNWFVWIGESLEPFYCCEEMESDYQKYITNKGGL